MRSLTCCLLAVVAVPIISLSIADSSQAAGGSTAPVPTTTSTGGVPYNSCTSITLANCERTDSVGGACRFYYPTQCRQLIQADLDAQAVAAGAAKLHIAGEDSANPGAIVVASTKRVPLSKLRVSGLNSTLRTVSYPMALAKYSSAMNLPIIDSAISSAATRSTRWASQSGYESCEEFANEIFPDLALIEDLLARYSDDSPGLFQRLVSDYQFFITSPNFGSLSFLRGYAPVPTDMSTFPWPVPWVNEAEANATSAFDSLPHSEFDERREGEPVHLLRGFHTQNGSFLYAKNEFFAIPDHRYPEPPIDHATGKVYCNTYKGISCSKDEFLPDGYDEPLDQSVIDEVNRQKSLGLVDRKYMNLYAQLNTFNQANTYYSVEYMEELTRLQEEFIQLIIERGKLFEHFDWFKNMFSCTFGDPPCPPQAGMGDGYAAYMGLKEIANDILPKLQSIDARLRELQGMARKYGCLSESPTNHCSLSPRLMRQSIEQAIRPARNYREKIYKACKDMTTQNFVFDSSFRITGWYMAPRSDYKFIFEKNYVPKPSTWTTSSSNFVFKGFWNNDKEAFKAFFKAGLAYQYKIALEKAEIQKLAKVSDNGVMRMGEQSSDSGFVGTDILGGSTGGGYSYNVSWMVKDYESALCRTNFRSSYDFNAYAKVFGLEVGRVAFKSERKTGDSTWDTSASLLVDGKDLVPPLNQSTVSGYAVVSTPAAATKQFFGYSQVVPVMGVPLTVSAYVDLYAGYSVDVRDYLTRNCGTPVFEGNDWMTLSNSGEINPYAGLLLTATGEVDAGVASIGVRGKITLVEIGLPWSLGNSVSKRTSDNQYALRPKSTLGLRLTGLGGSLTAFIDNPLHDVEVDLLSWSGISQAHDLQKYDSGDKSYSLKFACQALSNGCYSN